MDLSIDFKNREAAINFLYGRILEYLSDDAKDVFRAIGLFVPSGGDLMGLLSKLRYILNMEGHDNDDRFDMCVEELKSLKIIEVAWFCK